MTIGENLPPLCDGMVVVDTYLPTGNASDAATATEGSSLLEKDSKVKVMSVPIFKAVEVPGTKEFKLVRDDHPLTLPYE